MRNLLRPLRQPFAHSLNDDLLQFEPFGRIDNTALLKKTTKNSDYEVDPAHRAGARASFARPARTKLRWCASR